jgi:hypothetical protein
MSNSTKKDELEKQIFELATTIRGARILRS